MDSTFFTGYRKTAIRPDEVVVDLFVPFTEKVKRSSTNSTRSNKYVRKTRYNFQNTFFKSIKLARRKEDDIALVNAAFYVRIADDGKTVDDAELVFGGMSATAVVAQKTKSLLINGEWTEAMLDGVYLELLKDLPLAPNAPGGMVTYRKTLALRCECIYVIYARVVRSNSFSYG